MKRAAIGGSIVLVDVVLIIANVIVCMALTEAILPSANDFYDAAFALFFVFLPAFIFLLVIEGIVCYKVYHFLVAQVEDDLYDTMTDVSITAATELRVINDESRVFGSGTLPNVV